MCLRRVSWQGCCEASINECHAVTSTQLSCVEIDTNTQLNMRQLFIGVVASCCCGECNCTCGWRSLGGSVEAIKKKKTPSNQQAKIQVFLASKRHLQLTILLFLLFVVRLLSYFLFLSLFYLCCFELLLFSGKTCHFFTVSMLQS